MGYSTVEDVRDLTDTPLEDEEILRFITRADRQINISLRRENIDIPATPYPDEIIESSGYSSAASILKKHKIDGTLPDSINISGASASISVDEVIADYETKAANYLSDYMSAKGKIFTGYAIVGRDGERTGTGYESMTTDEQDEV